MLGSARCGGCTAAGATTGLTWCVLVLHDPARSIMRLCFYDFLCISLVALTSSFAVFICTSYDSLCVARINGDWQMRLLLQQVPCLSRPKSLSVWKSMMLHLWRSELLLVAETSSTVCWSHVPYFSCYISIQSMPRLNAEAVRMWTSKVQSEMPSSRRLVSSRFFAHALALPVEHIRF